MSAPPTKSDGSLVTLKPKARPTARDTRADSGDPRPAAHIRARFPSAGRGRPWVDVPEDDWLDWQWQQRNRVTSLEALEKVINLTDEEREAFEASHALFHMAITPYYASLMDPDDPNCPIRLQSVPKKGELIVLPTDLEDPLAEERDMPVPGITHRYPDRVLFYITHNCPVYCRHCTRKRKVSDPSTAAAKKQIEDGLAYIASHPEIRDVVISGGDPLSLSDERLDYILGRLRAIPHIEIFRLGTRNLVTLPQRVTDDFVYMLRKHHPVYVNTHFNHPKELTEEAFEACRKLADAGCVIGNQMVLLKGVNDDPKVVKELNHKLLMARVRPYYIYQCDLSQGISHFRTSV
ncbi:MAG TPA: KamA family radical SAM protein, partial [Fredinandcohnia sp.]|nr:KamA family radical SAM protein [Fredinandcohnia sp.]